MGSFRLPLPSSQIMIFLQLWKDAKGVWLSSSPWENVKMSCLEGSWVQVVFPSVLLTWMSRASSLTSVRLKIFISKIETLHLPAWAQNGLIWIGCISVHITKLWGMGWVVFQIAINCFGTSHRLLTSLNLIFLFWQHAFCIFIQDMTKAKARSPLQVNTNTPEHYLPFLNAKSLLTPKVGSIEFKFLVLRILHSNYYCWSAVKLLCSPLHFYVSSLWREDFVFISLSVEILLSH